ncbi:hypothetical protein [Xanthomonas vasicola]|uniref:hypothetical protein n=1 Tax=Xanthomonas vasicola TaxID=56459 RepID=UPI001C45FB71|nr:hypothetical protein [Xanthomonas vasicola]MBV6747095.1 hypothetical protein [Xanthomonas vasicola pv. vasculorum NCPPB 890]MBV6892471.1 hypothetical protein [Xanthomonas vasicola pv. vasculorum]MDO6949480.1 hypothetical protein [Xanthomonas vasicola]MDO6961616.1 hypothetical protein [Xanthomonas vasicola]
MKFLLSLLPVAGLVIVAPTLSAQSQEMIPPEMATRFVGKDGMVCGKVEKAKYAQSSEGEPTFLYMGGMFPRHTFSARIDGANRGKFSFAPETLEGKDVCVLGKIQRDSSRAEIEVSSPASLKLATIK